jgi:hypothetical protein
MWLYNEEMFRKLYIYEDCINYARHQKLLDQSLLLCFFKAYATSDHSTFGNLMMLHILQYLSFIFELKNIFIKLFLSSFIENRVGSKLKLHFSNVPFNHSCKLFD